MGANSERFPILFREQSVVVEVYRQKSKTTARKFAYAVTWIGGAQREKKEYADLKVARTEAALKASQLAASLSNAHEFVRSDVLKSDEARALISGTGVPLLSAVAEWVRARELAGPAVLEACTVWSERRTASLKRIKVPEVVDSFIADKNDAKKTSSIPLSTRRHLFTRWKMSCITFRIWLSVGWPRSVSSFLAAGLPLRFH